MKFWSIDPCQRRPAGCRVRIGLRGRWRFQDVGAGEAAMLAAMEIDPMPTPKALPDR